MLKKWNDMKLVTKLIIGCLVIVVFTGIVGYAGLNALAANNNDSAHDGHRALFDGWLEKSTTPVLQSWARLQRPVLARLHQLANLQNGRLAATSEAAHDAEPLPD